MNFQTWLIQVGKSTSSAQKYSTAITGVMSDWSQSHGISDSSLMEITNTKQFSDIADGIRQLDIFQQRNTKGKGMYSSALNAYLAFLTDNYSESIQDDIESLLKNDDIPATVKSTFINARVGQGKYRKQLIEHWQCCALTGFKDTRFLVASHIKPWSDATDQERLDPYNGLLLLPNLDKVFDLGCITFEPTGEIVISKKVENLAALGVKADMVIPLEDQHQAYMAHHRKSVFERKLQSF